MALKKMKKKNFSDKKEVMSEKIFGRHSGIMTY